MKGKMWVVRVVLGGVDDLSMSEQLDDVVCGFFFSKQDHYIRY